MKRTVAFLVLMCPACLFANNMQASRVYHLTQQLKSPLASERLASVTELKYFADPNAARAVLAMLETDPVSANKAMAIETLTAIGAYYMHESIAPFLQHRNDEVVLAAIEAFRAFKKPEYAKELLKLSSHPNNIVSVKAVAAAAELSPECCCEEIEALTSHSLPAVKLETFKLFSRLPQERVKGFLSLYLSDSDILIKEHAIAFIGDKKYPDFNDRLISDINSPDPKIRNAAIQALGVLEAQEALGPVTVQLNHADPQTRIAAVRALTKLNGHMAARNIADLLQDKNPQVIREAAAALGRLKYENASASFIKMLLTGNPFYIEPAAVALGNVADDRAVVPLLGCINGEDIWLDKIIINSIGQIVAVHGSDSLAPAFHSKNELVRANAVKVAKELKLFKAKRYITKILDEDTHPSNRDMAKQCLTYFETEEALASSASSAPADKNKI